MSGDSRTRSGAWGHSVALGRWTRLAALWLACGLTGHLVAAPAITFTKVPAYNSSEFLTGQATGVAPADYCVAVVIYVGGWWTKPYFIAKTTALNADGTWSCDVDTGGLDKYATRLAAFLVANTDAALVPEVAGATTLPAVFDTIAVARTMASRAPGLRRVRFSGYDWVVKLATAGPVGPGPNYFSDDPASVWVDEQGRLHLKVRQVAGVWYCAEVVGDISLGYGRYVFHLDSPVDQTALDPRVVLGLFTWEDNAAAYYYREIDLEFTTWNNSRPEDAQYVLAPLKGTGFPLHAWRNSTAAQTTHSFDWQAAQVRFQSYEGHASALPATGVLQDWTYSGGLNPPPGEENPRINLWLNTAGGTSDGLDEEVIIKRFEFFPARPLLATPTRLFLPPGGCGTINVRLGANPGGPVTVQVFPQRGATGFTVLGSGALTFDGSNWHTPQPVTVRAPATSAGGTTAICRARLPGWTDCDVAVSLNAVRNGAAEDGAATPADWASTGPATATWATDQTHGGTRSLKLVSTGGNSGWTQPAILLPEPWPYTITFGGWSQADSVAASATYYGLDFQVTFEDMTTAWYVTGLSFTKGTHGWENVDQTATFAKRVRQILPLALLYGGSGTQTVWFDDLYAIPRGTVTYNHQVENGSPGVGPDHWWTGANDLTRATGWATDAAASGSHALKISKASAGANASWNGSTFTFPPGDQPYTLTFSGWSKAANVSASGGYYTLCYYLTFADTSTAAYETGLGFASGTHDWAYVQRTNTFPKPVAAVRPAALFYNRTGTVWFDDIQAVPSGTVTHNHLAQDGTTGVGPDAWWTANNDLTRATGWAADASYSSERSLQITRGGAGASAFWNGQAFTFPADRRPYTLSFSGWHRTDSVAASGSTFGLYFLVTLADSSTVGYATGLAGTTGTHDWRRLGKTATFAQPVASVRPYGLMYGRTGTVWFDDLAAVPCATVTRNYQMEDGAAGVGPDDWYTFSNGLTRATGWATDAYYDGARSLKLVNTTGTNAGWYGAEFAFPAAGYPSALTVSAWSKTNSVAATETTMYGLMLLVTFSDGTRRWYGVDGAAGTHDWQKLEDQLVFAKPVKMVRPYCVLYGGSGPQTAWFDRITIAP